VRAATEKDQGKFNLTSSSKHQSASLLDYGNPRSGTRINVACCGRPMPMRPIEQGARTQQRVALKLREKSKQARGSGEVEEPRNSHGWAKRSRWPDMGVDGTGSRSLWREWILPRTSLCLLAFEPWNRTTCIHSRPSETLESIEKN
jgi:hypothetical protein